MRLIKITNDESKKYGVEIGDIFEAEPYFLDPSSKWTLIKKISGSKSKYKERSHNHYRINATINVS